MLVILEDWFPSFGAEFYDTLAYLFDVTNRIIVHPMHHVVLKFGPETDLATLSEHASPVLTVGYSVGIDPCCHLCLMAWL